MESFQSKRWGEHFRVDGSVVTITVYRACTQKFVSAWASKAVRSITNTEDKPPEPLQQKTVWGMLKGEGAFMIKGVAIDKMSACNENLHSWNSHHTGLGSSLGHVHLQ